MVYGRRHHRHLRSLAAWTNRSTPPQDLIGVDGYNDLFKQIRESQIGACVRSCPSFQERDGKCNTLGCMAPLGKGCIAQAVSREISR